MIMTGIITTVQAIETEIGIIEIRIGLHRHPRVVITGDLAG